MTVLRDGKPQRVAVVTGVTDGSFTEVLDGLEEGEQVVTDLAAPASGTGTKRSGAARSGGAGRPGGPPMRLF